MIKRLKKQRTPLTKDHFYFFPTGINIVQLRDRRTHEVIATVDKSEGEEGLKRAVLNMCRTYNTVENYTKHMEIYLHDRICDLNDMTRNSEKKSKLTGQDILADQAKKREKDYKKRPLEYDHIIEEVINDYYNITPTTSPAPTTKKRLLAKTKVHAEERPEAPVTTIEPKLITKKRSIRIVQ